jgi:nitrate reductase (NAD(P)H)
MRPSVENQLTKIKQDAGSPQKQFTREEIEKHDTEKDCWIVVDGKVYDVTSVLEWHPGGKAAVLGHAGKVHQQTSDDFASIHDDYASQKLRECAIGIVTEKAMNFIKQNAKANAKGQAGTSDEADLRLRKHRWIPARLVKRDEVSKDTRAYTFDLPNDDGVLGLGTCQHLQVAVHFQDRLVIRSYTPVRPLLPCPKDPPLAKGSEPMDDKHDGCGTFELVVKTYFPTEDQPGGALSNILDCMPIGEEVELRGPAGEIVYNGSGKFTIDDKEETFTKLSLVVGGSGLTPAYSLIARIFMCDDDKTEVRVVDANKSEDDVLLREELDGFEKNSHGRLKITHVLSHPSDSWQGKKGLVNADILKEALFKPGKGSAVFLCGPPAMIQKAALPALRGIYTPSYLATGIC